MVSFSELQLRPDMREKIESIYSNSSYRLEIDQYVDTKGRTGYKIIEKDSKNLTVSILTITSNGCSDFNTKPTRLTNF